MLFEQLIYDYTLRNVALGSAFLGILSGVLGTYAVLKKQSLIGAALSHSTLPGIVFAFLILGRNESSFLLIGAAVAALTANLFIIGITRKTKLKNDTALGIVLSVFFGFGLILLSAAQKYADSGQAELDTYIFGQAATIVYSDVLVLGVTSITIITILMLMWKEFKILVFDTDYTYSLGFPVKFLDLFLSFLIVVAIVLGLQIVGVILMSALIIAPAVAARQFTDKLGIMVILSGFFGAFAGVSGAVTSSFTHNLPTGPTIIIIISLIVFIFLLFAPKRGILIKKIRESKKRTIIREEFLMIEMYRIYIQHGRINKAHSVEILKLLNNFSGNIDEVLNKLKVQGFINIEDKNWNLTEKGIFKGKELMEQYSDTTSD